ncbi:hypothetical protein ECL_00489 [Enterobacter cloacae subsp. cloacae ATCC 13047]|uniref:Uncharacterized protein n=1 Tax=Enterobacter cloacae subsp. cloacae (strain ATCC 13047 / DSM 30054 / NBRC 13535 / NCTC 10005 / WDCM 00083 / NCDC 279-56) TaxID=716541 RepID=A0A0H3CFM7_ENTCC|nr:hypothetical protein ECL_00489 [Enterobacter cloacae subsp. cloacae ATCC 13047]
MSSARCLQGQIHVFRISVSKKQPGINFLKGGDTFHERK